MNETFLFLYWNENPLLKLIQLQRFYPYPVIPMLRILFVSIIQPLFTASHRDRPTVNALFTYCLGTDYSVFCNNAARLSARAMHIPAWPLGASSYKEDFWQIFS